MTHTTIWARPGGGISLVDSVAHEHVVVRTPAHSGTIVANDLSREEALELAAAIRTHYRVASTRDERIALARQLADDFPGTDHELLYVATYPAIMNLLAATVAPNYLGAPAATKEISDPQLMALRTLLTANGLDVGEVASAMAGLARRLEGAAALVELARYVEPDAAEDRP